MDCKKYLFILFLLMVIFASFADESLENQLDNGNFNIQEWNTAFVRENDQGGDDRLQLHLAV